MARIVHTCFGVGRDVLGWPFAAVVGRVRAAKPVICGGTNITTTPLCAATEEAASTASMLSRKGASLLGGEFGDGAARARLAEGREGGGSPLCLRRNNQRNEEGGVRGPGR